MTPNANRSTAWRDTTKQAALRRQILDHLREHGRSTVRAVSAALNSDPTTITQQLDALVVARQVLRIEGANTGVRGSRNSYEIINADP